MTSFASQHRVRESRPPRSLGRRRLAGVAAAAALVFSLSACDDHVGAAADVDGATIAESAVIETTGVLLADQEDAGTGSTQFFNRKVLTDRIRHELVAAVAKQQGVTVDEEQLSSMLGGDPASAAAALGVTQEHLPQILRDSLLALQIAQHDATGKAKATDVQVTIDLVNFTSRTEAVAAREKFLADPATMDDAVQQAAAQQQGGTQQMSLLTQPTLATYGLFTEPVGSVVLLNLDDTYSLARIGQRSVEQTDQLPASIQAAQQLPARFALAWLAVAAHTPKADVSVNPRFGTWDPVALQVVPTNSGL